MIVEDDARFAAVLRGLLEDDGSFQVHTAGSLDEAYAVIDSAHPDVIVLDLVLAGGTDATPLLDDLARMGQASPALVLMSSDVERLLTLASAHGVPYLAKPFDGDLARAAIKVAYEQRIRPLARKADGPGAAFVRRR